MASRDGVAYDGPEVDEEHKDCARAGIVWHRCWSAFLLMDEDGPDERGWGGMLGVHCCCQLAPLGVRWFEDVTEEGRARAELEVIADAHLLERHPDRSLGHGCGWR